ncbi:HAMP domain-containing sensor histidine kinase [Streptomyces ipomoeae]|uniref:histidine kinase n=1 Tax=Streptomyces ipomoeae 91-03 TaxID=698759 RepID=L1L5G4_9ACTN|nr:ATP-binding protein [Streptomyces ipomoeae]EKX68172.1 ATPase/histidine kinase/DNA gyrase B/HSP90 domain protein [Streptomyces ipomoeae 91-03]MDX2695630.1 HAMP domain-containing sensor histidine kinase [Streptomyces ipomoeae]MDX2822919.1 HAMP domain-containing sensor histidine kinase [Streptomyces ipomoeae]MDX2838840.1 HAMP domain-containing sensor histidine kinase [Streptomyces ipomoeae]MDX2875681.1 HAMP domain-containing sensor histidine kinase [Streptomyces ipomoeae]
MITRLKDTYRRMRLGTRLALGLGALALVVFAVVGSALTMYMRDYLSKQLNEQLRIAQVAQSKSIVDYGTLAGKKYYRWYYAVYDVKDGTPELRKPEDATDLPEDIDDFTLVAKAQTTSDTEVTRTEYLKDAGQYRLRACEVEPGVILVSAAPMDDIEDTVGQLVTVQVITFVLALAALVVFGRAMLRRGLKPLSDMAHTARGITSHDLTDSARLPVRHDGRDGGPEVQELRTAFNTMLEHIDDAFAVRTEAEQRLRRFVADASHELRTPLMSVRGYADLFQYAAAHSPEERDKHLARLRAEAARMGVLLDDLLMLARLDAADVETPLRLEEADLVELARQAADAFRAGRPDHPLTVSTGSGPVRLRLDPLRIRQVLDNLLTNAAVHTPPGTKVSLEVCVESGMTEVRITDSGPGIPADDQARVFDRFYRVDKARSRDRGGSGLGLAVARSLIRAHGGTIDLTSTPGQTTFTVRLPLGGDRG